MKILPLYEGVLNDIWYHGSPDVRDLERQGGFTQRNLTIDYVDDIDLWDKLQSDLNQARIDGNEDLYFQIIDKVGSLRKKATLRKPIFLTDVYSVAKSYTNPHRASDYQNAIEGVVKVKVKQGKNVRISALGQNFRFINIDDVKRGFLNAGVNPDQLDLFIRKLNFANDVSYGIRTDDIAAIGDWLGFDYIDVVGVLDSYDGGKTKSTVRMVFDPSLIEIVK